MEENNISKKSKYMVPVSIMAKNTMNPIRRIVDQMKIEPNPNFEFISLSIGDPTVFGNLKPHESMIKAMNESLVSGKYDGYGPATGYNFARQAVADHFSKPEAPLTEKDVILASACSGALELALGVIADPGDNVLVPKPGFSLYKTLCGSFGFETREYNLLPDKEWEADIEHMKSLIDEKTRCMIVNNPSNPCGSVYSMNHLKDILAVAEANGLPIIADEIYAYSVFKGETFYPIATLTSTVPVLSVGAISKRFLVPGWRLGWILIYDRNGALEEVRKGLFDLATRILGPNTVVQGALPQILSSTPQSFFDSTMEYIERIADLAYTHLKAVPGLHPVKPRGAMYMMVGLDQNLRNYFKDDLDFTQKLIAEKSVFCLPGQCFNCPDFFRVVLTVPEELMKEACHRIQDYCSSILSSGVPAKNGLDKGEM